MGLIEDIRNKAKALRKTIVLPESDDNRTLEAIEYILDKNIARITLIAKETIMRQEKELQERKLGI